MKLSIIVKRLSKRNKFYTKSSKPLSLYALEKTDLSTNIYKQYSRSSKEYS